ncbi:MAG: dynamin family protein, partial [Rubrivivax sp.]
MQSSIVSTLDQLSQWRGDLDRRTAALASFLADHDLVVDADASVLAALRERLSGDKLVLAFVAEFSRGKSELINAIFFADAGRRVLPATPGRTTMCPVELFHDAGQPARLSLLPIETRLKGLALSELRGRDEPWQHVPLNPGDPDALADALAAVTRTQRVSVADATALGFWSDEHPEDNPPLEADGTVEVPAWRHALINYPHALLRRGLVVLDTPGLNAIGAEPELTLSLLPSAHATVFVLAADTGVTKSDLAIWREHLGGNHLERFVVLNKIDALVDPLATPAEVAAQIERQRNGTAQTLGLPPARVFPLSARNALAARVGGDAQALAASQLPALEDAITAELLPRQHELLLQAASGAVQQLRTAATRRLADRRRTHAEQLLELRGLRGKSGAKVRLMLQRVDSESAEFEGCTARLQAVRAVQLKLLRNVLARLSSDTLRAEVAAMQSAAGARPLNLGARQAFATLCERLRQSMADAAALADEMRQMLDASFLQLNTDYGFAFTLATPPSLQPFVDELDLLAQNYGRYLTLGQAWRMATPGFAEQFRRMLVSKLRVVFENAAGELELWSKTASSQVDVQLRERRRSFKRRREALERIQAAAGELETRIAEVEAQDERLAQLQRQLDRHIEAVLSASRSATADEQASTDPRLR